MSKSKAKGTYAERGVEDFLNNFWFKEYIESGEEPPFVRIPSKGSKDVGDVSGPLTAIEVKNYSNPPVSALLNNAEWKSQNAGKPYWFLCYKAPGFSEARAHRWHCLTTVEELLNGFAVTFDGSEEFEETIPELCRQGAIINDAEFSRAAVRRQFSHKGWKPKLIFSDMMAKVPERRKALWEAEGLPELSARDTYNLPFIITPRNGQEGILPVAKWYVYADLMTFGYALEAVGVLPSENPVAA